ncbi:MAG: HYR domain-containing protein [Fimbriimonas sp.]
MNRTGLKGFTLALLSVASCVAFGENYLILHSTSTAFASDVRAQILATGLVQGNVDIRLATSSIPTVSQLRAYDAVLVFSSNGFQNNGLLGDNLADYADLGGGVVVAPLTSSTSGAFRITGRFASSAYSPFTPGATKQFIARRLGVVYDPLHPLMKDVVSFHAGSASLHNQVGMSPGAVQVADYDNGVPLVGFKTVGVNSVVGLNFFPPSANVDSGYWLPTTDGGKLMANALKFSVGVRNVAPVALGETYSMEGASTLTVPAPGLLANDSDLDGNALAVANSTPTPHGTVTVAADGSFTYTPNAGFTGTDTFTYHATDGTVESNLATVRIDVVDTTAPVISGTPADKTAEATGPSGATVSYTMPTATDLVDGTVTVVASQSSGSVFALGETVVTFTATDHAGNSSQTSFKVTVGDVTPPVISGTPSNQVVSATGPSGATFTYTMPTASDLVDGNVTVVASKASGSTFALGQTVVTFTATDAAGNSTQTSFTVSVVDVTPPVVSGTPGNQVVIATSASGATFSYAAPTANDAVDGWVAVQVSVASGSLFGLGQTTVTFTATDAAGNASQTSFVVWVQYSASGLDTSGNDVKGVKAGSVVQVRFSLTGASAGITNATARLLVNGNPDGFFSYDATSGLYSTAWKTKGLSAGDYVLRLDLGDGVVRTLNVRLR